MITTIKISEAVESILTHIMRSGGQAYLVGGALRDQILGRTASDYDIATSLPPEKIESVFHKEQTYRTGKRFGTIAVRMDGLSVEITTFRRESGYSDNRHPDHVTFVPDLESDLSRRDFTINAMAYNPFLASGLIDPFHGKEDLEQKRIRTVGDPQERFREDPLRVLRAIRLAAQLDFELMEETERAIAECRTWLNRISRERMREELVRLLLSPHPDKGVRLLQQTGILPILLSGGTDPHAATEKKAAKTCTGKEMQVLKKIPESADIRLAALLQMYRPSADPMQLQRTLRNLRISKKSIQHIRHLLSGYSRLCTMDLTPYSMRKLLGAGNPSDMEQILQWYEAVQDPCGNPERKKRHSEAVRLLDVIRTAKDPVFPSDLAINGKDVLSAGIGTEDGKKIGRALRQAYEWVLEKPEENERTILLEKLKRSPQFRPFS
ncbi:hypothetical protein QBE55_09145 [Eubacteriales bacterium mix99]